MIRYPQLKLENQLCFPLYASAKEIVRRYKPFLDPLGLTYTQYIVLMVLWDKGSCNVTELGEELFLDSGTLTPVLKKLESKGFIERKRSSSDERQLTVTLTTEGENLQNDAAQIPFEIGSCVSLTDEDTKELYCLLYRLLRGLN